MNHPKLQTAKIKAATARNRRPAGLPEEQGKRKRMLEFQFLCVTVRRQFGEYYSLNTIEYSLSIVWILSDTLRLVSPQSGLATCCLKLFR